jgi:hypothetical protein
MFNYKIMYKFMIFVATKNGRTKHFFLPLLVLLLDPGSEIRDPGATLFLHFTSQSVFCMFFYG